MTTLEGKWALVTGASRGIGREVSIGLAKLGCGVVLHGREEANCAAVAEAIAAIGTPVVVVAGELSDQDQVDAVAREALRQAGQIDILYNNAAIQTTYLSDPWSFEANEIRRILEVNVISLIRICEHLAPPMLERGWGRIVNVTSGIRDQPELFPYAISKAAVDKYVRDFAPRLAGTGVTMNLLDPGWLRTDMGGPNATGDVASVLPGALVPALLENGVSGQWINAQAFKDLTLDQALAKAVAG